MNMTQKPDFDTGQSVEPTKAASASAAENPSHLTAVVNEDIKPTTCVGGASVEAHPRNGHEARATQDPTPTRCTGELDEDEKARLKVCCATIKKHFRNFFKVAEAVYEIQTRKLYRGTHKTIETFMEANFGIARSTAYHYCRVHEVIRDLSSIEDTQKPTTDAQVRPLIELEPTDRKVIWETVVRTAEGKPITGPMVEEEVRRFKDQNALRLGTYSTESIKKCLKAAKTGSGGGRMDPKLLTQELAKSTETTPEKPTATAPSTEPTPITGNLPDTAPDSSPLHGEMLKKVTRKLMSLKDMIEQDKGKQDVLKLLQEALDTMAAFESVASIKEDKE